LLYANQLSLSFGDRRLLDQVTFQIGEQDKIGLVGRNGAGKTTLLNILSGKLAPDKGNITMPKGYTIGYLPQELENTSTLTVLEETKTAFGEINHIKESIAQIEEELHTIVDFKSRYYGDLVHDLAHLHDRLRLMGAQHMDREAATVLTGLGFKPDDLAKPTSTFSGGWRMRIELGKLLLQQPDLLLLDEPTNHLDIESIIWLEQYLAESGSAVMLVSHDKTFLDKMTNRTFELVKGKFYDYRASYNDYLLIKEQRKGQLIAQKKSQEKFVEHTEALINKFRAKKNKAAFAQTLIRKLDKLEEIELEEEDARKVTIRFPAVPRSGLVVVKIEGLSKWFGEKEVLRNIAFELHRGEKVAFVGKNGEGKTTLSRIIAGLEPFTGRCVIGTNVEWAFYGQHTSAMLDPKKTVYDTIEEAATGEMHSKVRALLGAFLFSGDDADKKVRVLSGGEKARLALAKLLLKPANLLILDEPTNHLDIVAKDVLKQAIMAYTGSVIVVSHDRDFLSGLTTKTYEFTNKAVKEHIGDVTEFLENRKSKEIDDVYRGKSSKQNVIARERGDRSNPVNEARLRNERKKELQKQQRKLQKQVSALEQSITALEAELADLDEKLRDPVQFKELSKDPQVFVVYEAKQKELATLMADWEKASGELDGVSGKLDVG
jgi:ATP-binding cassette subfamily F protein 3